MPLSPLFSLPFLAMGALAVVMGVLSAVGKNGLPHRVGYDVETGIEEETIAGLMEDVDKTDRPSAGTHDHIPSTALDAGERLKQLEDLKKAGLITQEEYQEKRREILSQPVTEKGGQCHETGQRAVPCAQELQTRIRQLESRLDNNALVQEGSLPQRTPWSC